MNERILTATTASAATTTLQPLDNHTNDSDPNVCGLSEEDHNFCRIFRFVLYCIIIGILVVFGFLGNSLSFCVFGRDKVKTSTLFLFQSLAIIDNCLLVTVFPVYFIEAFVSYAFNVDANNEFYYDMFGIIDGYIFPFAMVAQTATVWLTVLVAFNRYVAVCKPYKAARLCTVRQAKCQLSVVIIFSVIYNLPRFAHPRLEINTREDNTTYIKLQPRDFASNQVYINVYETALYLIIMLLLPLVILNVLNVKLVKALKELNRKRVDMMQSARQKHDNNVTLVLIIVVVVFIVCQAPALANRLRWSFPSDCSSQCKGFYYYFAPISNVFVVMNSSVNFIIYLAFNARFRQTICESHTCRCLCSCFDSLANRCSSKSHASRMNNSSKKDCNCFTEAARFSEKSDQSAPTKSNWSANSSQAGYKSMKLKQLVTTTNSSSVAGTFNNVTTTSTIESSDPQENLIHGLAIDPNVQVYMGPIKE